MSHWVFLLATPELLNVVFLGKNTAYSECSNLVGPFLLKKLLFHDKLKGLQCKVSQVVGLRQSSIYT